MCGIAGFWAPPTFGPESAKNTVARMTEAITYRGPDDHGAWVDPEVGLALGHRRLSIIDMSLAGHQPMHSAAGRLVIVFNGEIYNHLDLRAQLPVRQWRGHSDTETLLAALEIWGVEGTLERVVGMFAFALWDRETRVLTLARDRLGEKPLYYGWQRNVGSMAFLFASELKSFRFHPAFEAQVDRNAVALQLRYSYIPAPYSIYRGVHKLLPGHFVQLTQQAASKAEAPTSRPYWSLARVIQAGRANRFEGSERDAVSQLDTVLRDAVRCQMVADVSLGAFLSGGIDSSTIVALMQAQASRPVKTFTIGFQEKGYDEAQHAKVVARHLGTEHTELYVSPAQARDVIPRLPEIYDEPFSDSSQIPTFLVSQLARQHVTVCLSGDAGDELFGGYNRYFLTHQWWNRLQMIPERVRHLTASTLAVPSPATWGRIGSGLAGLSGNQERWANLANRIPKLAAVLRSCDSRALYTQLVSHWLDPADIVVGATEPSTVITNPPFVLDETVEQMMAVDTVSYMPDDILVKVDRAAMSVSLETRVPFLDHRVVEFAWRLPLGLKVRHGRGKWILRQVLNQYVPAALIDRPKMGFGVPIDSWLRGPLRDWAEGLLAESRLRKEGYFEPAPIRSKWVDHLSGRGNWQYLLWDVLMFQSWLERQPMTAKAYAPAA